MRKYEHDAESTDLSYHAKFYKHFAMQESKKWLCDRCPWHGGENRRTYRKHYSWKLHRPSQYRVTGRVRRFKYPYLRWDPL